MKRKTAAACLAALTLAAICTGCGMGLEEKLFGSELFGIEALEKTAKGFFDKALSPGSGGAKKQTKKACDTLFEALAEGDSQTAADLLGISEADAQPGALQSGLLSRISVETEYGEVDGDTASVPAMITAPDMEAVLRALPETVDSREAALAALLAALEAEDVPMKEFSVTISLTQTDGAWQVCMTPELADALSGGYYSMLNTLAEGRTE